MKKEEKVHLWFVDLVVMVNENHVAEQFMKCSDLLEGIVIDLLDEFEKNQDKWYIVMKTNQACHERKRSYNDET